MRKKLVIVSSYGEDCGNASYTHVLKEHFGEHVDVEIARLDTFLLSGRGAAFRRGAERHITQICRQVAAADYVNIQFELGLFGADPELAVSRALKIMRAAPNLVVTFHRIDVGSIGAAPYIKRFLKGRLGAYFAYRAARSALSAYERVFLELHRMRRRKNVWALVHTPRERRIVKDIMAFPNCADFPITFLSESKRDAYIAAADRDGLFKRHGIDPEKKIIGLFGFISSYKGLETALDALRLLPDDYAVAIFGSIHPQAITPWKGVDEYLADLIDRIDAKGAYDERSKATVDGKQVEVRRRTKDLKDNLATRVRFVGNLNDDDFITALRVCDAVALPYLETGQSMSGVAALALEVKSNAFFARNKAFMQMTRYYGDAFHFFDIGNYAELAQKISSLNSDHYEEVRVSALKKYNIDNNVALHMALFENKYSEFSV